MGTASFLGVKSGRGVGLTPHPHLVPKVLEKSRAIPFTHPKMGENLKVKVKVTLTLEQATKAQKGGVEV